MIWIDRSISKTVTHAIDLVRGDVRWVGDLYDGRTADAIWLRDAGQSEALVIVRDKKVRTRPLERAAIMDNRVGCFIVNQGRNPTKWEYLRLIVVALDEMQQRFEQVPRPFIFTIDSRGVLRKVAGH